MHTTILACFLFYCVETCQALQRADQQASNGMGLEGQDKSLLSLWTNFFSKNRVSNNHVRTIRVNESAWRIELVMNKTETGDKVWLNSSNDVCEGNRESGGWNVVALRYKNDTMCFAGQGFETRARSAVIMIEMALKVLHENTATIEEFDHKTLHVGDMGDCTHDFAYALPWDVPVGCKTALVPDFTFWAWPEAGLIPDYETITGKLHSIRQKAQQDKCGWAGNPNMNNQRRPFINLAQHMSYLFEIITPASVTGTGGGRISMEEQARRWACMIDLPGAGYSGRVPMLLHTGRPLLSLERKQWPGNHYTDNTWYAKKLVAGVHYLPVNANLTNMEGTARFALSTEGRNVGEQGRMFALAELTTEKAIKGLAEILNGSHGSE